MCANCRSNGAATALAMISGLAPGSVADGDYRWSLEATDAWGNGPLSDYGGLVVDTRAPDLALADAEGATPIFTPNGDGVSDIVRFAATTSEPGSVTGTVHDGGDQSIDHLSAAVTASGTLAWLDPERGLGLVALANRGTYAGWWREPWADLGAAVTAAAAAA